MSDFFPETPEPDSQKETGETCATTDYLKSLRPNWDYFDVANRIIRVQDAYDIAQSKGMEKDEFCELASGILGISLIAARVFLDSVRPNTPSSADDAQCPSDTASRLIKALEKAKDPKGTINHQELKKAYQISKEAGISEEQFFLSALNVLDCRKIVVQIILEDSRFNKKREGDLPIGRSKKKSTPIASPAAKSIHTPQASIPKKQPVLPNQIPDRNKPAPPPRTYKSRPAPLKIAEKKQDSEVVTLRSDWDRLSGYERMEAVKKIIDRLKSTAELPVVISTLAQKLNRSESTVATYYHLAGVRPEIIALLQKAKTDIPTAIQIESILNHSKNIDSEKLFATLAGLSQLISIQIFRDILQDCFKRKAKDWKRRVTVCRIIPGWTGDGEVLSEYELIYIPFTLLSDDERKRFNFTHRKKDAYVTFQLNGEDRYSKVPIEALEPIHPNQKG